MTVRFFIGPAVPRKPCPNRRQRNYEPVAKSLALVAARHGETTLEDPQGGSVKFGGTCGDIDLF